MEYTNIVFQKVPINIFACIIFSGLYAIFFSFIYFSIFNKNLITLIITIIITLIYTFLLNYTLKSYLKNVEYNIITEKKYVSFLPNEHVDSETNTFIVDGQELEVVKLYEIKYYNNKNENPYITVEKITYKAPYKWYTNKQDVDNVNSTTKYVLKEIHF